LKTRDTVDVMEAVTTSNPDHVVPNDVPPDVRPVPRWLAIGIIVLAFAGAGWFVYSQFFAGPRAGQEVDIGTIPRSPGARMAFRAAPPSAPPADGISSIGPNYWRVKTAEFTANLALQESPLAPIRVFYGKADLISPEQAELMAARRQLVANQDLANQLKLTPEQLQKLSAVPLSAGQGLKLDASDREKLKADWQAWLKADAAGKKPAEQKVLATLKDIGTRSLGPTREEFANRAAEIKSVLTDDQLKEYRQHKN
jgi:hypothetical protein